MSEPSGEGAQAVEADRPSASPLTSVEASILEMLRAQLGGEGDVGVDDDLFGLGADSVMAAQLFNEIQAQYGVEIDIEAAFGEPTVRTLARLAEEAMMAALETMSDEDAGRLLDLARGPSTGVAA